MPDWLPSGRPAWSALWQRPDGLRGAMVRNTGYSTAGQVLGVLGATIGAVVQVLPV